MVDHGDRYYLPVIRHPGKSLEDEARPQNRYDSNFTTRFWLSLICTHSDPYNQLNVIRKVFKPEHRDNAKK